MALVAAGFGIIYGGFLGSLVGYVRGRTETAIMSVIDVILAFPALILLLAMAQPLTPMPPFDDFKVITERNLFDPSRRTVASGGASASAGSLNDQWTLSGIVLEGSQRLALCDQRLRDPRFRGSISEIAYECGFGDQAQFSRSYRARFGCTPSEARVNPLSRRAIT